jgi:hypothetical protein
MDEPAFRAELRERRAAQAATRALRAAGVGSLAELKTLTRAELLGLARLGPLGYDYLNDALNRGDDRRLERLFEDITPNARRRA